MALLPRAIEFLQTLKSALHLLVWRNEVSNSEVVRAFLLFETRTGDGHDACLVHHVHAVEEIRLLALRLRLVDELLREVYLGEPVHRSLNVGAGDIFHASERVL